MPVVYSPMSEKRVAGRHSIKSPGLLQDIVATQVICLLPISFLQSLHLLNIVSINCLDNFRKVSKVPLHARLACNRRQCSQCCTDPTRIEIRNAGRYA
jgi:hypothetical protein